MFSSVRSALLLFGCLLVITQALFIPSASHDNGLTLRGLENEAQGVSGTLNQRSPKKGGGKRPPKPDPAPAPKPDPAPAPSPKPKTKEPPKTTAQAAKTTAQSPSKAPSQAPSQVPSSTLPSTTDQASAVSTLVSSAVSTGVSSATSPSASASGSVPASGSTASSAASGTVSSSTTSSVRAATTIIDVCNAIKGGCSDFDSTGANEDEPDPAPLSLSQVAAVPTSIPVPGALAKRGNKRPFKALVGTNQQVDLESFPYPSTGQLFVGPKGKQVLNNLFDTRTNDLKDVKVEALKRPVRPNGQTEVTEHIVELQTIKLFMETAAKTIPNGAQFFVNNWNTLTNQAVFSEMGSNGFREDFVLCNKGINGVKALIWDLKSPIDKTEIESLITEAAKGSLVTLGSGKAAKQVMAAEHLLTKIRQTIAAVSYMSNSAISKRLQSTVARVRVVMNNIGQNATPRVDLATEWDNFMKSHLEQIEKGARDFVKDVSTKAKKEYQDRRRKSKNQAEKDRLTKEISILDVYIKAEPNMKMPAPK